MLPPPLAFLFPFIQLLAQLLHFQALFSEATRSITHVLYSDRRGVGNTERRAPKHWLNSTEHLRITRPPFVELERHKSDAEDRAIKVVQQVSAGAGTEPRAPTPHSPAFSTKALQGAAREPRSYLQDTTALEDFHEHGSYLPIPRLLLPSKSKKKVCLC